MLIFKIFRAPEWAELRKTGSTQGAPVDLADGFIHFSTLAQVEETAARHFAGARDLMLVAVEAGDLGDKLMWEPSRGGALFPHLYRPLRLEDVRWAQPFPEDDSGHHLPPGLDDNA